MRDTTDISKITTMPSIESIDTTPTIKKIKLPDPSRKAPLIYIPVQISIEKPGSVALGIFLFLALAGCSMGNVFLMFMHQIIVVK
jgi:hypothetical protein